MTYSNTEAESGDLAGEAEKVSNSTEGTTSSDEKKVETATSDNTDAENSNSSDAKDQNATIYSLLPPEVTLEPRNDEEMHLGLFNGNLEGILAYLSVSDDNGEVLGDVALHQRVKAFCDQYSGSEEEPQDIASVIEEGKTLLLDFSQKIHSTENRLIGTTFGYHVYRGTLLNIHKRHVKAAGLFWGEYLSDQLSGLSSRTVQEDIQLAEIHNIIRYVVFGKDRNLQIIRQLTDDEKKGDDPIGSFIRRNGIDFNPQEELDVKQLKIKTDTAINQQKLLKAGLDIPMEQIETFVRGGSSVEKKLIDELEIRRDAGQDIDAAFKDAIAKKGKIEPIRTPKRDAENVNKRTTLLIGAIKAAEDKPEYFNLIKIAEIEKLKAALASLEAKIRASISEATERN